MQDRRDFFKSIAGLFAVAAVNPSGLLGQDISEGSFYSNRPDANLDMTPKRIQDDLEKLTRFMHAELLKQVPWQFYPAVAEGSQKVSMEFPRCFGVDFRLEDGEIKSLSDQAITDRYVLPAMTAMANEIKFNRARKFAQLPLPGGVDQSCRVTGKGISLRGIHAYDIRDNQMICQFDTLFG